MTRGRKVKSVRKVTRDPRVKSDPKDHRVSKVKSDPEDNRDPRVKSDPGAHKEPRVKSGLKAPEASKVFRVFKVKSDPKAPLVHRVLGLYSQTSLGRGFLIARATIHAEAVEPPYPVCAEMAGRRLTFASFTPVGNRVTTTIGYAK